MFYLIRELSIFLIINRKAFDLIRMIKMNVKNYIFLSFLYLYFFDLSLWLFISRMIGFKQFLSVLTSDGVPLFNINQMNDTCFFEEDAEHAFRLKPVESYYGSWTFTFTNPNSVSRLVSNSSQIKLLLIPSNNITYPQWAVSE